MKEYNFLNIVLFTLIFSIGCSDKIKSIKFDENLKAVGKISNDTVFDGTIKFYDLTSNRLVRQCSYLHGVLDGERIDYYNSGVIENKINYDDGKLNGYGESYNDNGLISSRTFYYYD